MVTKAIKATGLDRKAAATRAINPNKAVRNRPARRADKADKAEAVSRETAAPKKARAWDALLTREIEVRVGPKART
ncbi:MAG TPA: hypothetical protein VEB63_10155 [Chitinophagaceae bacterium]|nr:hypothetical protein [Chitinophagaceae bacterium]